MDIFGPKQLRILVADDESPILNLFQEVLSPENPDPKLSSKSNELADKLFGKSVPNTPMLSFDLVTCQQGNEAVDTVKKSLEENRPFAVAFLDVRMPPGPDGIWAAEQIRALDPNIEIVIVTGFSDINPKDIASRVPPYHKLLYVNKPFHSQEIFQFASALGSKWLVECELHRTHQEMETRIQKRTQELDFKTKALEELNTALKILLDKKQEDQKAFEEKILSNVRTLIEPYMFKLKNTKSHQSQQTILTILEDNLNEIVSPFTKRLSSKLLCLTPTEIQVSNLIKNGKTNKDIANIFHLSKRTIEFHRENIRKKLGLKNKKTSLKTYLLSIS